jgi:SAM-dependent methyltransferase
VIEIGLGVGTVARYIAPKSNRYLGVDISKESCTFVKGTFEQRCYEGTTLCCSILELPESLDASFDIGIAIGSLHHTGLLAEAVNSLERTVKPGGKILIMVYNQFDLRRVIRQPLRSIFRYFQSVFGVNRNWPELNPNLRALCDVDLDGFPAPHTSFTTKYFFKSVSLEGVKYKVFRRNFHDLSRVHSFLKRENFLGWPSKILGCHLYAVGTKKI